MLADHVHPPRSSRSAQSRRRRPETAVLVGFALRIGHSPGRCCPPVPPQCPPSTGCFPVRRACHWPCQSLPVPSVSSALPQPQASSRCSNRPASICASSTAATAMRLEGSPARLAVLFAPPSPPLLAPPTPAALYRAYYPPHTHRAPPLGERLSPKLSPFQISAAKAPPDAALKPSASGSFASTAHMSSHLPSSPHGNLQTRLVFHIVSRPLELTFLYFGLVTHYSPALLFLPSIL